MAQVDKEERRVPQIHLVLMRPCKYVAEGPGLAPGVAASERNLEADSPLSLPMEAYAIAIRLQLPAIVA